MSAGSRTVPCVQQHTCQTTSYTWKDAGSPDIFMVCMVGIIACLAWLGQIAHEATHKEA